MLVTPLMNAVLNSLLTAELLLEFGADSNMQRTGNGDTPLITVVRAESSDAVLGLLQAGADYGICNQNGDTAMALVRSRRFGLEKRRKAD